MKTQTHDWADEAAEHLMNFALDRLQENIALTLRDIRAQFEAGRVVSQPAAQPEREAALVKAARRLIKNDDEERRILEPSCQECTKGNTPNNHDKGPCDWHELLAAVAAYAKPDPLRESDSTARKQEAES